MSEILPVNGASVCSAVFDTSNEFIALLCSWWKTHAKATQ